MVVRPQHMTQGLEWEGLVAATVSSFTAQKRARETTGPTKIGFDKQKNLDDTKSHLMEPARLDLRSSPSRRRREKTL